MGCKTSKEAMQAAAENTSAAAQSTVANLKQEAETVLNSVVEQTKDNVKEVVEQTKDNVKEVVEEAEKNVKEVVDKMGDNVKEVVEKAKDNVKEIVKRVDVSEIDLNDPEANRAATKIQAAFRGHQTRKNMKQGDAESKPNLKEDFNPENKAMGANLSGRGPSSWSNSTMGLRSVGSTLSYV